MNTPIVPKPLKKGDIIAVIAPSSPPASGVLERALISVSELGLQPKLFPSCVSASGYLAGSDEMRARDINSAFADPSVSGILCLRGGYGTMRLLNLLDYDIISKNPKRFFGYSDITALHTVFNQKCGFVTFHAPMPSIDYGTLDDFTVSSLYRAMFGDIDEMKIANPKSSDFELETICGGSACGILAGGNLSLLTALLGSPFAINGGGKIIFIEEINEAPYRIDRMLMSLRLAGVFDRAQGVLLGSFEGCCGVYLPDHEKNESLTSTFRDILSPLGIPVLAGLCCGHSYPQMTLPLGCNIVMNTDKKTIKIVPF